MNTKILNGFLVKMAFAFYVITLFSCEQRLTQSASEYKDLTHESEKIKKENILKENQEQLKQENEIRKKPIPPRIQARLMAGYKGDFKFINGSLLGNNKKVDNLFSYIDMDRISSEESMYILSSTGELEEKIYAFVNHIVLSNPTISNRKLIEVVTDYLIVEAYVVGSSRGWYEQEKNEPHDKAAHKMETNELECEITSNVDPNGVLVRYTRPEPIGEADSFQYAVSVQFDGDKYFLFIMIRFAGSAYRVEGDLIVRFSGGFTSVIAPERNELKYGDGSEMVLVLYELSDWDIENIKSGGKVETFNFRTEDGVANLVTVKDKGYILKNHYNCFQ